MLLSLAPTAHRLPPTDPPQPPLHPLRQLGIVGDGVAGDDDPAAHRALAVGGEGGDAALGEGGVVLGRRDLDDQVVVEDDDEGRLPGEEAAAAEDVLLARATLAEGAERVVDASHETAIVGHLERQDWSSGQAPRAARRCLRGPRPRYWAPARSPPEPRGRPRPDKHREVPDPRPRR